MAKYYVRSGELEKVVNANSPLQAALKAVQVARGEKIDPQWFFIDERGFRGPRFHLGEVAIRVDMEPYHIIPTSEIIDIELFDDWEI